MTTAGARMAEETEIPCKAVSPLENYACSSKSDRPHPRRMSVNVFCCWVESCSIDYGRYML